LSNLPGSSLPGEIHFRENQYVIQPGDPNPLGVQANMDVHDLCDSPTTHGCTGVAGSLQFTSITKWCAKPSPMCSGCDARFQTCMAGPASAPNPLPPVTATECIESFDLNANGRVDLRDFAIYQVEFTRE
jgi:hypothetical protein